MSLAIFTVKPLQILMEKLNLDIKKGLYEIEVNDKGETIVFDTEDIELPFKFNDAYLKVEQLTKDLTRKEALIEKQKECSHGLVSNKDEKRRQLYKEFYKQMREAMDEFLGAGGVQKIFGDRNYPDMYNDLFDALKPHLEKIGISSTKSIERIEQKYSESDEDVLE